MNEQAIYQSPRLFFDLSVKCKMKKKPKECKSRKDALEMFVNGDGCTERSTRVSRPFEKGFYGEVSSVECMKGNGKGKNTKYVMKRSKWSQDYRQVIEFYNELRFGQLISQLGLGPRIIEAYPTPTHGVIIMEHLPGTTLTQLVIDHIRFLQNLAHPQQAAKNLGKEVGTMLGNLLYQLHSHGFAHGDLHANNVMFDGKRKKMIFIDFARSSLATSNLVHQDYDWLLTGLGFDGSVKKDMTWKKYIQAINQSTLQFLKKSLKHVETK